MNATELLAQAILDGRTYAQVWIDGRAHDVNLYVAEPPDVDVWRVYEFSAPATAPIVAPVVVHNEYKRVMPEREVDGVPVPEDGPLCLGCAAMRLGWAFHEEDDGSPAVSGLRFTAFWVVTNGHVARALCEDCTVVAFGLPHERRP